MRTSTAGIVVAALLLGACRAASRAPAADVAAAPAPAAPTAAPTVAPTVATHAMAMDSVPDVRFLRHMVMHHQQALDMSALVPARTQREDLRLLAERIAVSQESEIAFMNRWLARRGAGAAAAAAPSATGDGHGAHNSGHHGAAGTHDMAAGHASMPGMLTRAELDSLSRASGPAFDAMFLRYMIRHHEGALAMVADHLRTAGAARESELFSFVSDIDADQRAEIRRMRALEAKSPR